MELREAVFVFTHEGKRYTTKHRKNADGTTEIRVTEVDGAVTRPLAKFSVPSSRGTTLVTARAAATKAIGKHTGASWS